MKVFNNNSSIDIIYSFTYHSTSTCRNAACKWSTPGTCNVGGTCIPVDPVDFKVDSTPQWAEEVRTVGVWLPRTKEETQLDKLTGILCRGKDVDQLRRPQQQPALCCRATIKPPKKFDIWSYSRIGDEFEPGATEQTRWRDPDRECPDSRTNIWTHRRTAAILDTRWVEYTIQCMQQKK